MEQTQSIPVFIPIVVTIGATLVLAIGLGIAWSRLGPKVWNDRRVWDSGAVLGRFLSLNGVKCPHDCQER